MDKKSKVRIIIIGLVLLLGALAVHQNLFISAKESNNQLNLQSQKEEELIKEKDALLEEKEELMKENEELRELLEESNKTIDSLPKLNEHMIKIIKEKGLESVPEDLINDLLTRNDLIPHEGILGGTTKFRIEEGIYVLSPKWVLAGYSDGHFLGALLLSYDINEDGTINWKVLDDFLY